MRVDSDISARLTTIGEPVARGSAVFGSPASAATSSAMGPHRESAARYYSMDMYDRCPRTGRGHQCVEFPVKWGDPYLELWILMY